jgi:hypothetical protein
MTGLALIRGSGPHQLARLIAYHFHGRAPLTVANDRGRPEPREWR